MKFLLDQDVYAATARLASYDKKKKESFHQPEAYNMTTTLYAIYDGKVLRLDEPIPLAPNTRVRITIETSGPISKRKRSFLETARSLNLEGPSDWSARFEDYLYKKENELNG